MHEHRRAHPRATFSVRRAFRAGRHRAPRSLLAVLAAGVMVIGTAVAALNLGSTPPDADAVVSGVADQAAKSSSVLIYYKVGGVDKMCSGSLISEWWVLTAAHCARPVTSGATAGDRGLSPDATFGATVDKSAYRLRLGTTTATANEGYNVGVSQVWAGMPRWTGSRDGGGFADDVAFLRLAAPAPATLSPLPLAPSRAAFGSGTPVVFTGWGRTSANDSRTAGVVLRSTRGGDWKVSNGCGVDEAVCYSVARKTPQSSPAPGDSGAPVTATVRGARLQIGVYSGGPTDDSRFAGRYGAAVPDYLPWVRDVTGLTELPRNTVVRQGGSRASWFVDADGFRHAIPTTAVFGCLTSRYGAAVDRSRFDTLSAPEDTAPATCTASGPGGANTATVTPAQIGVGGESTLSITYTNRLSTPMYRFGLGVVDTGTGSSQQGAFSVVTLEDAGGGPPNWCAGPVPASPQYNRPSAYYVCQPEDSRDSQLHPGETVRLTVKLTGRSAGTAKLYIGSTYLPDAAGDAYSTPDGEPIANLTVTVRP